MILEKLRNLTARYYYLVIPLQLFLAGFVLSFVRSSVAVVLIGLICIILLGIVLHTLQIKIVERDSYERQWREATELLLQRAKEQSGQHFLLEKYNQYLQKAYLDVRLDRAALIKTMTAFLPAGYRNENYVLEAPLTREEFFTGLTVEELGRRAKDPLNEQNPEQTFLYLDYRTAWGDQQLRIRVSAEEKQLIGQLPEYTKTRTALIEAESRWQWREFLVNMKWELGDGGLFFKSSPAPYELWEPASVSPDRL